MWISAAPATPRIAVPPALDAVAVFKARCEARALLYGAGDLDLHDAVDELEQFARALGINRKIGIDGSQAIMAAAFKPVRERESANSPIGLNAENAPVGANPETAPNGANPDISTIVENPNSAPNAKRDAFLEAYRRQWEANRKYSTANCSLSEMQAIVDASMRRRGTPQSTIDALLLALRRGLSCLADPGNRDHLRCCDEAAIRKIATELMTWPGKTKDGKPRPWLPAWEKDDVAKLLGVWRTVGGSKT